MKYLLSLLLVVPFCISVGRSATAEVVRFEIDERRPFADGNSFGDVGAYEHITGKVHYTIDPAAAGNAPIVDLELAQTNEDGKVAFSADLDILAPVDPEKGNGALLYDVNNRGNRLALRFLSDANGADDGGNGFLMRRGYTVVWSGWDGELLPGDGRLQLHAPVANRTPTLGLVRYEIVTSEDVERVNINRDNHGSYRPSAHGLKSATLTWRLHPHDARVPIPREQFQLHVQDVENAEAGQLPQVDLELPAGLQRGYLYELIYEAEDPLVHGVCFAAVRDLMSALEKGEGEGNPLLVEGMSVYDRSYGFGVSQSGRFLREFLHTGFNADERGRRVFEGLMPHVAGAGLGSFNHRFAQPSAYASQHEHHDWPTDRFPFAYTPQQHPVTRTTDSILRESALEDTAPLIIHTQSSTEYWSRGGSLVHTDATSPADATMPERIRIFAFGGTQHGPADYPPKAGAGQTAANPADYRPMLRALLDALDQWHRGEQPAPPSVYPTIADGTLVHWDQASTGFPAVPGVRYPEVIYQPPLLELGPRWESQRIIDTYPPVEQGHVAVLVPACDNDGNERGCLLPPEVAVPLATHSGWSLRSREAGAANELVGLDGSYIPFPKTAETRRQTGDPRQAVSERYSNQQQYLAQLEEVLETMVAQRYLLEEDVPRILERQKERTQDIFKE